MQEASIHSIKIDQRKEIEVSGAVSVIAFSDTKITLEITGGVRLYVVGNNIKISGCSSANGSFYAKGEIQGVSYGGKSFASKLFK